MADRRFVETMPGRAVRLQQRVDGVAQSGLAGSGGIQKLRTLLRRQIQRLVKKSLFVHRTCLSKQPAIVVRASSLHYGTTLRVVSPQPEQQCDEPAARHQEFCEFPAALPPSI